ncbi:acetoin utilization protein AcuC [Pontibacillus sp. HMF3514]|uniref:acetoin utilization protein AcuC n=1 Tax=Pontibacillus sp. HMF3514 TaxID=2692425 RepID=UPI00131F9839|nr:acetoin utilization protein AcuC [Pontibacillus sp. HMF3514]QHE53281.1 acetoin utilization protein AcuC [Pontibacillus sp. HMF3514]
MAKLARDRDVNCHSAFVYSDEITKYRFRDDHPFNQMRVILTYELLKDSKALDEENIIPPRLASDEELNLAHDKAYINAVKKASVGELSEDDGLEYGIGTEDTPIFENMHEAASLLVGGTLTAVESVMHGHAKHALNLGGGLHHGFQRKASGFCIYNDGAVAIQYLRKHYDVKVLYIDTDAHHGDGVQWAFYDDPNVCTLSIHETGRYLFPGTGNVNERGIKEGYGYSFNVPIDAFTEDESFQQVYESAFREVVEYFQPDVIVSQNGADAHVYDPLTHLCTTMSTFELIPQLAHELAHQYCDGKWIALGGGGYDIWRVVPRAWAQIWKVMSTSTPFHGELPEQWLSKWNEKSPVQLPTHWNDPSGMYKPIPRKPEITEKNEKALEKALQFIRLKYNSGQSL